MASCLGIPLSVMARGILQTQGIIMPDGRAHDGPGLLFAIFLYEMRRQLLQVFVPVVFHFFPTSTADPERAIQVASHFVMNRPPSVGMSSTRSYPIPFSLSTNACMSP